MENKELQYFCSKLSKFVVGTEGNLSYKWDDNGFSIKESGTSFDDMSFIPCLMDGNPYWPDQKPSMEVDFHSFIYRNSDYKIIAHTHPTNILKILCSTNETINQFANKRFFPDQVVFNGSSSCVVPYATPGKELTYAIQKVASLYSSFPSLFLLKNHGIICCANSVKQAVIMTEICEKSAEIFLSSASFHFLTKEQICEIQNHPDEIYRKK